MRQNLASIQDRFEVIEQEKEILPGIGVVAAPGHTVGHVAVHLKSGNHRAVMCGDLMHTPLQLAEPGWSPTFEYDMALSTKTRKTFLDTHCDSDTMVLTSHFPSPSVGHIISRDDGFDFSYV